MGLSIGALSCQDRAMPIHKPGANYSLPQLLKAYNAEARGGADDQFLLCQGADIVALCLRHKFHHDPGEVWVGTDPALAEWGRKLATLKDKKTLPLYYSGRGRTLYEYKDQQVITGDTEDPQELMKRKGHVPLSRIVFLKPVQHRSY
jgi:hypothetical protein